MLVPKYLTRSCTKRGWDLGGGGGGGGGRAGERRIIEAPRLRALGGAYRNNLKIILS